MTGRNGNPVNYLQEQAAKPMTNIHRTSVLNSQKPHLTHICYFMRASFRAVPVRSLGGKIRSREPRRGPPDTAGAARPRWRVARFRKLDDVERGAGAARRMNVTTERKSWPVESTGPSNCWRRTRQSTTS